MAGAHFGLSVAPCRHPFSLSLRTDFLPRPPVIGVLPPPVKLSMGGGAGLNGKVEITFRGGAPPTPFRGVGCLDHPPNPPFPSNPELSGKLLAVLSDRSFYPRGCCQGVLSARSCPPPPPCECPAAKLSGGVGSCQGAPVFPKLSAQKLSGDNFPGAGGEFLFHLVADLFLRKSNPLSFPFL